MEKIGEGAMGAVYMASHPVIGKKVALKVIHPELATNEEMLARFFNEARAVTQIGHQNIVDVQDFGQTPDGDSFIVMELLEGRGLGDVMKAEGPFPLARALHIAAQMADGLLAAHARGIIHRDLKPDNVMLIERQGDPDFVKILDFGLAKLQGPGSSAMALKTKTGSLLGTPHYMAPEQAEGKKIDHRVDVYALGCMLFQLLTGRVPFPGEGFGEVLVKHLREPPPLPSRLNPAVTPAVEKIVLHALAKKPEFRFKSMEEFGAALKAPEVFAASLDSAALLSLTPAEGMPAPELPRSNVAMGPPPAAPPSAPANAPVRLSGDAQTVMAAPAPEVQAILAARLAHGNAHEVATAPSMKRVKPLARPSAHTMAEPAERPLPRDRVRRKRRWTILIGFAAAALALSGAALMLLRGPSNVSVTINTEPSGAELLDGERLLGTSPAVLALPRGGQPLMLTVRKPGFLSAQRALASSTDQLIAVRLLAKPPEPAPEPAPPPPPPPKVAEPPAAVVAAPAPPKPKHHHKKEPRHEVDHLLLQPSF